MRIILPLCGVLLLAAPVAVSSSSITYYLDGARVETEAGAVKGQIEIPLPFGIDADSVRIKPLQGVFISRVEFTAVSPDRKMAKEIARLTERKDALADRLKALDTKEDIFRAAAKSQSGKAPRTTKTNREPLENIRKGTDFAIAQLEEVYKARRKAENELKSVETRLFSLKNAGNAGGRLARVWLSGKNGRVTVSYLHPGLKWAPMYDFRLDIDGEVEVIMHALFPETEKGVALAVVPAHLSETATELPIAIEPGRVAKVAVFRFPLEKEKYTSSPISSLSFSFKNRSDKKLPPGESNCYRQGEYIGKNRFDGCLPGESKSLDFGKVTPTIK